MGIIGNRVKKYLVVTCPKCHESYEVDYKYSEDNCKADGVTFICPWCMHETKRTLMEYKNINTCRIVKFDQLSL